MTAGLDAAFLARYHAERSGITEDLLAGVPVGGCADAYAWLAAALQEARDGGPSDGVLLDLCCGTAPVADHAGPLAYLGVDASGHELAAARARRPGVRVLHGDATAPPRQHLAAAGLTRPVAAVSVAMALMLLDLEVLLPRLAAATTPGTRLAAVVPTRTPPPGAEEHAALLTSQAGHLPPYVEPLQREDLPARVAALGWRLLADEDGLAARPLLTDDDVALVASSFYATTDPEGARRKAAAHLQALRRNGTEVLAYPLRRLVLERTD